MTDTVTFNIWEGSMNVFKGVDISGLVSSVVSVSAADFVVPAGIVASAASVNGRRAWAGFDAVTPGLYPVEAHLTLSDGQEPILIFYIRVVPRP